MISSSLSNVIREKREELGITNKEFADALGLGKNGDKLLREWEQGSQVPSEDEYKRIISFAKNRPYSVNENQEGAFRFIDLFAGIGGIRIPFQELGGKCVFSSEWDQFAQKTYRVNYGEIPQGDITQIESSEIPDFDILLAGFPCQPFSSE